MQEITSNRSEVQRLYQIKENLFYYTETDDTGNFFAAARCSWIWIVFAFQKPITHPVTESEILQFITCFGAIVVTIFLLGNIG